MLPCELVKYANQIGLKNFSITDHDSVDFYFDNEAEKLLKKYDMNVITGCEFVCKVDGIPIEILGYGIDVEKAKSYLALHGITQNKLERIRSERVPALFKKYGINLDYDENKIDFSAKDPNALPALLESINRNEKAKELVRTEDPEMLVRAGIFLRKGLNNRNSIFNIDAQNCYPDYKLIIKTIHSLGGIASLAHPYQYYDSMDLVIEKVCKAGIDAIECWHYTTEEKGRTQYLQKIAKKHNLLQTGGSDFHNNTAQNSGKNQLNKMKVPLKIFSALKDALIKKANKEYKAV